MCRWSSRCNLHPLHPCGALMDPADGSSNAPRVSGVTVTFSEPINPGTFVPDGIVLEGAEGIIPGALLLDAASRVGQFLPDRVLEYNATYTTRVSSAITDLTSLVIEGPLEFTFTTEGPPVRLPGAELIIYEPGATNCPCVGTVPGYDAAQGTIICVQGTPGVADGNVPVVLVNEDYGSTATVVSNPDGSFLNFVEGSVSDFISATFVNANNTRIRVAVTRQKFDDGRVGLYRAGGILEAESDGGPVRVFVEPGAVEQRTVFTVESFSRASMLQQLGGVEPAGGTLLAGIGYEEDVDELIAAADVSVPINIADLTLAPGQDPTNAFFAITVPVQVDGKLLYKIIDTMHFEYEDDPGKGRLVTRSPPYTGLLQRTINAMLLSARANVTRVRLTSSSASRESVAPFAVMQMHGFDELTVFGKVGYRDVKAPEGTEKPLAGALVFLRERGTPRNGLVDFGEGELIALTGRDGSYAFGIPGSYLVEANAHARHPAFPFQIASAGPIVPDEIRVNLARADLFFVTGDTQSAVLEDLTPPVVYIAHEPALAPFGLGETTYADLLVNVVDDVDIQSIGVNAFESYRILNDRQLAENKVVIEELESNDISPGRKMRLYRVQSEKPARVRFVVYATDGAGRLTQHDYFVNFTADPSGPPVVSDNKPPLNVVGGWPLYHSRNVPSLQPITLRFNEPIPETAYQTSNPEWLQFPDGHKLTGISASEDRRELTFFYATARRPGV
jgi:hypothetical protein